MLSIIIPTYNAQGTLKELCSRLHRALAGLVNYELLLVNDASTDNTAATIQELQKQYRQIISISNRKNIGQHPSIFKGLAEARGDYVVVMDCDLQDRPEDIVTLWRMISEHKVEAVLAQRNRQGEPRFKRWGSQLFYMILGHILPKVHWDGSIGNFGIYQKALIQRICADAHSHFFPISVQKHCKQQLRLAVAHDAAEQSNYSSLQRIRLAWRILQKERSLR